MSIRIKYFLKNYFLNFQSNKLKIYNFEETATEYKVIFAFEDKKIEIILLKTDIVEKITKQNFINKKENKEVSIICNFKLEETNLDKVLLKTRDDINIVTYQIKNGGIKTKIGINLIDEIFYHLSGEREYKAELKKGKLRPYYLEKINKYTNEPIVDYHYLLFTDILNSIFEIMNINEKLTRKLSNFNICLTHDVDVLYKNFFTNLRYSGFLLINFIKELNPIYLKKMHKYLFNNVKLNNILKIIDIEQKYNIKSSFYFFSKQLKGLNIKSLLIDPCYDISKDEGIKNILKIINEANFEIGLHTSYCAAKNYELLKKEKQVLEEQVKTKILSTRNHFLNFSITLTPEIFEKAEILYDTSFYYNNVCGFLRHKTCSPFYFFSHKQNKILNLIEFPTVVMDATLYNYLKLTDEQAYNLTIDILSKVKKFKGIACINWHNETYAPTYGWYLIYKDIIGWIIQNKGTALTLKQVYNKLINLNTMAA